MLLRANTGPRIAVLLSGGYSIGSGMGRSAAMLCNALLRAFPRGRVVFGTGIPSEQVASLIDADCQSRLSVRSFHWASATDDKGKTWLRPISPDGNDFLDCEMWILYHPPSAGVVAPLRPFAIFCADLLSRIVPEAFDPARHQDSPGWLELLNSFETYRLANMVFTTTERTRADVVAYAGVPAARTIVAPQFAESRDETEVIGENPVRLDRYFLWTSNDTPHKNHERAFRMLERYYSDNPSDAIPVVLTGVGTEHFDPRQHPTGHPYHDEIRVRIAASPRLMQNVIFMGTLARPEFLAVLKGAAFLWHNVIYDNGTAAVYEAAEFGVPSLATDYPQMRFFDEKFGTNARFFSPFDIDAGADALASMTRSTREGARASCALDHERENARFHRFARSLVAYLRKQSPDRVASSGSAKGRPLRSQAIARLRDNAASVWPPLARYLDGFPFGDSVFVALVIATEEFGAEALAQFAALLREDYRDFKLLVFTIPELRAEVASNILGEVLAFDFLYAGDFRQPEDAASAYELAQVVFTESAVEHDVAKQLRSARVSVPLTALNSSPAEVRSAIRSGVARTQSTSTGTGKARFPATSRNGSLVNASAYDLDLGQYLPASSIDFSQGDNAALLEQGFFDWEAPFRWVGPEASVLLGSPVDVDTLDGAVSAIHVAGENEDSEFPLFLDLEFYDTFLDSSQAPTLAVFCNGERITDIPLAVGRRLIAVPIAPGAVRPTSLNRFRFEANIVFRAGGEGSPDDRMISWQAYRIVFARRPRSPAPSSPVRNVLAWIRGAAGKTA